MSKIPLYTQTSHDWHCNKNQPNKPYAVDLNVGTNEYIFGRVTPNNKFIVSTGLVNDPKPYGIQMVGGKKTKSKSKPKPKSKPKSKSKKGGNGNITDSFEPSSLSVYNENNYKNNELIFNALDKINKLNGLNSPCKNSMINAQNNIVGGANKKKTKKKLMKGGEETKGATGMPPQYYASKMPEKVIGTTSVKPNDFAVLNLSPISGGKKTMKKKTTTKKPVKKTTTKKPVKKTTTKKPVKKTTTKKPVKKTTTKKPVKKTITKKPVKKTITKK